MCVFGFGWFFSMIIIISLNFLKSSKTGSQNFSLHEFKFKFKAEKQNKTKISFSRITLPTAADASCSAALLLPQMLESQVEVRQKEVEELQGQSQALSQEGKGSEEVDGQRVTVERKFNGLQAPLRTRREKLMASREIHQFNRDVEDEIVSVCVCVCVEVIQLGRFGWGLAGQEVRLGFKSIILLLLSWLVLAFTLE